MFKKEKDLFDVIENTKIKVNRIRKNKRQSIKDFLDECEVESNKILKTKELILK